MARLSLALLGPLRITLDGQTVSSFAYNKARALLAYLAVEADRPHRRDALVGLLWPELPDTAARTNLRQALANLREAIDDAAATPPFLLITRDTIQFNLASDYELDVTAFVALLAACQTHPHRSLERCRSCAARMAQAISLYRGDLLAEFSVGDSAPFEEWQLRHREQLHQRALDALADLADYHERRGDEERARRYAQRQIELDPWREEAHRQLMRLLACGGQRSAALEQYETCKRILARDLGVAPAMETTELYEQIRDGTSSKLIVLSAELPSPGRKPHNVQNFPAQITPLIGRESELADLGALLENPACRLITIVGPGGIGKTRLALAAAAEQAEVFTHGATFVPLQALSSAAFLASAILAGLDVGLQGQRDPRDQLLDELREKELLLLLDNFEQLLAPDVSESEGAAALLTDILQRAPGVTLLLTSRERLALQGEWLFELSGLSYPAGESIDGVEGYSAIRLFVQRAGQVRRKFALAEGEAHAVARICRLVEGMPLAIELAATALRSSSCTAIAAAIETSLAALATVLRAVPERHRSMWATFEHSWRLLSDEERQAFTRLSVFRGGFQEEAAAQVAQASPQLLASLLDKSLLRWDGAARYDMHELVRQYAAEKLEQAGEATHTRKQHAAYFLGLAQAAEPKLRGPEQSIWLARFEAEHDNLRAVLNWALDSQEVEMGLRLAGALGWFWYSHDHFSEGRTWLAQLLTSAASRGVAAGARVRALTAAGALATKQGDYPAAAQLLEASLTLAREVEDKPGIAHTLGVLGWMAVAQDDYTQAIAWSEESLRLYREIGDKWGIAQALANLGEMRQSEGNYAQATVLYDESLMVCQEAGDKRGIAFVLSMQALLAQHQGDYARVRALAEQSLRLFGELKETWGMAWTRFHLGRAAQQQGDYGQAAVILEETLALFQKLGDRENSALALMALGNIAFEQGDYGRTVVLGRQSLRLCRELGKKGGIAAGLEGLAAVAGVQSQPERAARLFGAAMALREAIGAPLTPGECPAYERNVATVRGQLDASTFEAAWAAGRVMALEQAIAYALEESEVDSLSSIGTAASPQ
jgi:predicted ATPase/DNA-binding SARP family transcriptional activator